MKRILSFDVGTKRIGVAATDSLQLLASPIGVCAPNEIFEFVYHYLQANEVEQFVVGLPIDMQGKPSHAFASAQQFAKTLTKKFAKIPVTMVDERFTSQMALHSLQEMQLKKSKMKDKKLVDAISAVILLEHYLQYRPTKNNE